MAECVHPISIRSPKTGVYITVACGKCVVCLRSRASAWAARCVNESFLYRSNLFVTLTYSIDNLPPGANLCHEHFQKFMRDVRYWCKANNRPSPRYFMAGEYGSRRGQPHYHAILFNFSLPDLVKHSVNSSGDQGYTSVILESIWGRGFVFIGDVNPRSCRYIANYVSKRMTKGFDEARSQSAYYLTHEDALLQRNAIVPASDRLPEYCRASTRPGIGSAWIDKYHKDVFSHGLYRTTEHSLAPIPRYYKKKAVKLGYDLRPLTLKAMAHMADRVSRDGGAAAHVRRLSTIEEKALLTLENLFSKRY